MVVISSDKAFIPQATDASDLSEVIALIGSIARYQSDLEPMVLGDREERVIANIVQNIERFTQDARGILEDNRQDVRDLVSNIREFSRAANDVLDPENRERIERILANFDSSMVEVKGRPRISTSLQRRLKRVREL